VSEKRTVPDMEFSEQYDQEDDVYYVTFKTGEPSRVEECDDSLLIEVGIFTGLPTGFRIMNFSQNRKAALGFKDVLKKLHSIAKSHIDSEERALESRFNHFIDKVIA